MRNRYERRPLGSAGRAAGLALLMALAPAISLADVAGEALSKLSGLEGWWRFAEQDAGCEDEDNQYRAAIGRWMWEEASGAIVFGKGAEQKIGFYESSCELSNGQTVGSTLIFDAACSGEGESWTDRAVFEMHAPDRVMLSFSSGGTHDLVRCPR